MDNKNGVLPPPVKKPSIAGRLFGGIAFSFLIMGLFMGVQFVVALVFMIVIAVQYALEAPGNVAYVTRMLTEIIQEPDVMTNLTVVATAISAVLAVFFYWLILGRKKTESDKLYFKEKVLRAKNFFMVSIATVGLYFLALILENLVAVVSPDIFQSYSEMMEMSLGGNVFLVALAVVLLAPISEECIMRGLILRNLQKYFSAPVAIVIQAVMFGIFHMNWVQGLYVIPLGLAMGFLSVKGRSIFWCIYMHMLTNFMSFVVGALPEFCHTIGFCIITIIVCGGAVWGIWKRVE